MFKKILLFIFLVLIVVSQSLNDFSSLSKDIKNSDKVNLLLTLNNSGGIGNKNYLRLILFQYCRKNKNLKILFIDDNITILQKKLKSKTINEMFFERKEEERVDFIKKEMESLLGNKINIGYYVFSDTKALQSFIKIFNEPNIEKQLGKEYFKEFTENNDYLTSLVYIIKVIKHIVGSSNRYVLVDFLRFLDSGNYLVTNLKLADALFIYSSARNFDAGSVRFADIPTVNKRNRIEADPAGLEKIINFISQDDNPVSDQPAEEKTKIEVINASLKTRLAIKAVDKLRENGFDIFEWGTSYRIHEYSVIYDLINNYKQAFAVKNILNAGEIIFRPAEKSFVDISVLLGKDCTIYDKLDKINKISQET